MKKRILSFLLCISVVTNRMELNLAADQFPKIILEESSHELTMIESENSANSGICGENLNWSFSDGVLTISGYGEMYDYSDYNAVPWGAVGQQIQEIVVTDGVNSIGDYAFYWCSNLRRVVLPGSLTRIGSYAFYSCKSLDGITLPENLLTIGSYAFGECEALERIILPHSVTELGAFVFAWCTSLNHVVIPGNISRIEEGTFWYCIAMTDIALDNSVTSIGEAAFGRAESLKTVYYIGSSNEWGQVNVDSGNEFLMVADIH